MSPTVATLVQRDATRVQDVTKSTWATTEGATTVNLCTVPSRQVIRHRGGVRYCQKSEVQLIVRHAKDQTPPG